jgi:hypothetical protein
MRSSSTSAKISRPARSRRSGFRETGAGAGRATVEMTEREETGATCRCHNVSSRRGFPVQLQSASVRSVARATRFVSPAPLVSRLSRAERATLRPPRIDRTLEALPCGRGRRRRCRFRPLPARHRLAAVPLRRGLYLSARRLPPASHASPPDRRFHDDVTRPAVPAPPVRQHDTRSPPSHAHHLHRLGLAVRGYDSTHPGIALQGPEDGRSRVRPSCPAHRERAGRRAAPENERGERHESRPHLAARAPSVATAAPSCRRTRASRSRARRPLSSGATAAQPFSPRTFAAHARRCQSR